MQGWYGSMPSNEGLNNEDSTRQQEPQQRFPTYLLPLVPEVSPYSWMMINNVLAISGCILIADSLYAVDNSDERSFATAFRLEWEFGTCFFWTLETALSACYQYYHLNKEHVAWYTKLEIAIAGYFMLTSLWMLLDWNVMNVNIENEHIVELSLDTAFYVYMSIRSCFRSKDSSEESIELNEGGQMRDNLSYERMPNASSVDGAMV